VFARFWGGHLLNQPTGWAGTSTHGGSVERELKALQSLQFGAAYLAEDAQRIAFRSEPSEFIE
jgi:hypothetical protein